MITWDRPLVYTGGTFDLFHYGHVSFLHQCSRFGNVVVVLNSDEFVERFKGSAPIVTLTERILVVSGCKWVKRCIANRYDEDSASMIEEVSPEIVCVGSDWARKDYYKQMGFTQDWLDERCITLAYVPYTSGVRSSDLRLRLATREA